MQEKADLGRGKGKGENEALGSGWPLGSPEVTGGARCPAAPSNAAPGKAAPSGGERGRHDDAQAEAAIRAAHRAPSWLVPTQQVAARRGSCLAMHPMRHTAAASSMGSCSRSPKERPAGRCLL